MFVIAVGGAVGTAVGGGWSIRHRPKRNQTENSEDSGHG